MSFANDGNFVHIFTSNTQIIWSLFISPISVKWMFKRKMVFLIKLILRNVMIDLMPWNNFCQYRFNRQTYMDVDDDATLLKQFRVTKIGFEKSMWTGNCVMICTDVRLFSIWMNCCRLLNLCKIDTRRFQCNLNLSWWEVLIPQPVQKLLRHIITLYNHSEKCSPKTFYWTSFSSSTESVSQLLRAQVCLLFHGSFYIINLFTLIFYHFCYSMTHVFRL